MRTIAFHSTKGGVGRTSALMNFAKVMRAKGKIVLILELDFDAPGLAFKYGSDLNEDNGSKSPGYIDYLSYFNKFGTDGQDFSIQSNIVDDKTIKRRKIDFLSTAAVKLASQDSIITKNAEEKEGQIKVICAGIDGQKYWSELSSSWFHELFSISQNEYSSDGSFLIHKNRKFFKEELEVYKSIRFDNEIDKTKPLKADYLLVDCRSAREFSSAPLYYWADLVVHMFPNNSEGFIGADRMMRAFKSCREKPNAKFMLVGSRVPRTQVLGAKKAETGQSSGTLVVDNNGFMPTLNFGDLLNNFIEREKIGADDLKKHIKFIDDNEQVFVLQEAINATMGESYLLNPNRYLDPTTGRRGTHSHTVANDYARIFHQILVNLDEAPSKSESELVEDEKSLADILGDFSKVQRSDLYMMLDREGQAFNTDGNQNVLLRNESVQVLIKTLEAKVVRTLKAWGPKFAPEDGLRPFFDSGLEVGLGFGVKLIWNLVAESQRDDKPRPNLDFEHLVKDWCRFDGKDAAFGIMTPAFSNLGQDKLHLDWTKPFLASEAHGESKTGLFISSAAKKFLCGYALGNVIAYDFADEIADNTPRDHKERLNPVATNIIEKYTPKEAEKLIHFLQPVEDGSGYEAVQEDKYKDDVGFRSDGDKFMLVITDTRASCKV